MNRKIITRATFILLWMAGTGCASATTANPKTQQEKPKTNPVDQVLEKLHQSILDLKSYQGQIEWKFKQPSLFDSQDLRKGILYYTKEDNKSKLRLNFQTRKQDDDKEHKYLEQYIVLDGALLSYPNHKFEGTWLVCIDYQIEEVKYGQLSEPNDPNQPADVFDLVSKYLPIIGFSKIEEMKEQFEVSLVVQEQAEPSGFTQLHLKVKPDSIYKDDYTSIDFWIDKKLNLPAKIIALTTEEDIYEIKFLMPKINNAIEKKVFEFKMPKGFGEPEIIPLKEKNTQ